MNIDDIKLEINHLASDGYENGEKSPVCTLHVIKKEDVGQNYDILSELNIENKETGIKEDYCMYINDNYENRDTFFNDMEYNCCMNIDISYKKTRIGRVCLNRLFVEDALGVVLWMDNEAPNSMQISSYICKTDFKTVEGRFIGIIDELVLDDIYVKDDISAFVIYMIYSLIRNYEFNIYYLYTQPKFLDHRRYIKGDISLSVLKMYQDVGFEIVDKERYILCKDLWHENKGRHKIDDALERVYLP